MENQIERNVDGTWTVYCTDSRQCEVLNKRFRKYPATVDFIAERSEGIFDFTDAELSFVRAVLINVKSK